MKKLFVLFAAAALVVAFTVPAMAADWSFYGSSRMYTKYLDTSKEKAGLGGEVDDADLFWDQQTNSRIGANVKAGALGGNFEYGHSSTVDLRKLFGYWNFGAGKLTFGQDYTPIDTFWAHQLGPGGGDNSMISYGAPYTGRQDQVRLDIASVKVALIQNPSPAAPGTVTGATDVDTGMPMLEACWLGKFGPISVKPYFGYNTYEEVVISGTTETSYDVDYHILGVYLKGAFGPFWVAGNIYTSQNPGNAGLSQDIVLKSAGWSGTDVEDCDSMAYLLAAGFQVSNMLKFEAGYGVVSNERDIGTTTTEEETTAFYIQATITPVKGFMIVPEIGKVDYGDRKVTGAADTKLGDKTYYGAKWQINF
jgi:hypothetical protein